MNRFPSRVQPLSFVACWIVATAVQASPAIDIVEAPPACCAGTWAGTVVGTVSGVDPDSVRVVVYAETDLLYVQPYEDIRIAVGAGGTWRTATRGGNRYVALLVRPEYRPEPRCNAVPPVGGAILAVASAPDDQRQIEFAGMTFLVKSSGEVPFGPGPNLWSDDEESVWVDAAGRLHLRLASRDGVWRGAEVFSAEPRGYGQVRFEVASRLDGLDPNVVAAGFLYADGGAEIDVEFARWGDASNPHAAQFALQPDRVHAFAWEPVSESSVHTIAWMPDAVRCTSREGGLETPGAPRAEQLWSTDVPVPERERLHFNLWLHGGHPPADGQPVEFVIAALEFDPTSAAPIAIASTPMLQWTTPTVLPLRGWMALPTAGNYSMQILDVRGRRLARTSGFHGSGNAERFSWDPGALAAGVYFLELRSEGYRMTRRLVVTAPPR